MAVISGMPVASIRPGTIRKPRRAEETGKQADREAGADKHRHQLSRARRRQADGGIAAAGAPLQHQCADCDHEDAEQHQQILAVELLGDTGAGKRAGDAGKREHDRAGPSDVARAPVRDHVGKRADRYRNGAGADRHMRRGDTDAIDQ